MVDWTWVYGGLDLGIWWSLGEAVDWRRVSTWPHGDLCRALFVPGSRVGGGGGGGG